MQTVNLAKTVDAYRALSVRNQLLKIARLAFLFKEKRKKQRSESFPIVAAAIAKGLTVVDTVAHKQSFLFEMLYWEQYNGKLITFQYNTRVYKDLLRLQQLLRIKNVIVQPALITAKNFEGNSFATTKKSSAAVIDFITQTRKAVPEQSVNTLDSYCFTNNIVPALLKIGVNGNEVNVLEGAIQIIEKHKPAILIECGEKTARHETLPATFKLLSDLNYSGYFLLNSLKIPLRDFDFNTYRNEIMGFYCNTFYFK